MSEKSSVKQYFKECFEKKLLIRKGIIAAAALALVLIFSLSFYFWLRNSNGLVGKQNGFWYISVVWNPGIGFSKLNNNLPAIFTIQSLMFVLLLGVYIFLCDDDITCSFVALAMWGGLFNLLQRAGTPTQGVLDYFRFGFWDSFPTFNWPDMFVVIGIFGFVITYIVMVIIEVKKEDAEAEKKLKEEQEKAKAEEQRTSKQPEPEKPVMQV